MKWPDQYRGRNMHFWCTTFGNSHRSHSAHHAMLGDEEDGVKERYETEERSAGLLIETAENDGGDVTKRRPSGAAVATTTAFNCPRPSADPPSSGANSQRHNYDHDSETATDLRMRDPDARDFRIGNTVLSPYCCVGLIIFALLFILIGSVLTYAITRHSDAEVLQFLKKHNYLKAVSPILICSGIIMLLLGITFWVVRRCRGQRRHSPCATAADSFFPPEGLAPQRCPPPELRTRSSLGSAISSRAVSPLLPPLSAAGRGDNVEWKWPSQQAAAAPPLGSFPRLSSNESSPIHGDPEVHERMMDLQNGSTIAPCDYSIPDVKVIPVGTSSAATTTTANTGIVEAS